MWSERLAATRQNTPPGVRVVRDLIPQRPEHATQRSGRGAARKICCTQSRCALAKPRRAERFFRVLVPEELLQYHAERSLFYSILAESKLQPYQFPHYQFVAK